MVSVHEYFHLVQGAIGHDGDPATWRARHAQKHAVFDWFLHEVLAQWVTDEPITVGAIPGHEAFLLDATNDYLTATQAAAALKSGREYLLGHNPYDMTLLAKYLAEQIANGNDVSRVADVLRFYLDLARDGSSREEDYFAALLRGLPESPWSSRGGRSGAGSSAPSR